jgi:hypothetical protein
MKKDTEVALLASAGSLQLFKEGLIYEQSAPRTLRERP